MRSPKDNGRETSTLGGNAVYAARALYRQVNDTLAWDDQLLCLPHGIIVKSIQQQDAAILSIVPNPARDNATLVVDKGLDGPGVLLLFNAIGQEVLRKAIPLEVVRMEFSTGSLAPGLYHYRVRGPSGMVGEGKLAISR